MLGDLEKSLVVPDSIEPVIGWRAWSLEKEAGRWRLASPLSPAPWEPGKKIEGFHQTQGFEPEILKKLLTPSPFASCKCQPRCGCGINAFLTRQLLEKDSCARAGVIGQVKMWGKVNQHEKGYRSQYAYPNHLIFNRHTDPDMAHQLADDYSISYEIKTLKTSLILASKALLKVIFSWAMARIMGAVGTVGYSIAVQESDIRIFCLLIAFFLWRQGVSYLKTDMASFNTVMLIEFGPLKKQKEGSREHLWQILFRMILSLIFLAAMTASFFVYSTLL